jgi:hypothetical protein
MEWGRKRKNTINMQSASEEKLDEISVRLENILLENPLAAIHR